MKSKQHRLQVMLDKAVDQKKILGTSFCLKYGDDSYCVSSGNLAADQQYFIASTTKLFVTAIIMQYRSKGLLTLEDKIDCYLPTDIMDALHVYKGKDYSAAIHIKNLLAHTSGLPDYFQGKDNKGDSLEKLLMDGTDRKWSFEKAIERSKLLKPSFIPGTNGKALYADTNFQLLGRIIERISGHSIAQIFEDSIISPLGLTKTYLYADENDARPKTLYYKTDELQIPKAMTSFGPDGGIVSTSEEMMVFLEAFFGGALFPKEYIEEMRVWNKIFFPMQSGVGIHRFKLLRLFDPFDSIPELIGHSGLSGALAFCNPEKKLYVTGTVNQVAYPDTSFRLMIQLIREVLKTS